MENSLDHKTCLTVFNHILSEGQRQDDKYHWQGFEAWSDFDGYTCFLKYAEVTLTMMFHGKYELDYPDQDALHRFEKQILKFKHQHTS